MKLTINLHSLRISEYFQFFILFSLSLGIIYSPCLLIPYAYHDDFLYFSASNNVFADHPQYQISLALGRIGTAVLINTWQYFIHMPSDLLFLRLISILQLSLAGTIVYHLAKKIFKNSLFGYLINLCIFTLPAFAVMASWAAVISISASILLASSAAFFSEKITTSTDPKNYILNSSFILSIAFLFLSLITYPAASGFYWAIAFLGIAVAAQESFVLMKQKILNYFFPAIFSYSFFAAYYLSIKESAVNFTTNNLEENSIYNLYSITSNIPDKIIWFFKEPLNQSLNLWNIFPSSHITVFTCIVLAILLYLWLSRILRKTTLGTMGKRQTAIWLIITFPVCLGLSFLPNLVTSQHIAYYRCCAGLTALILILFFIITSIVTKNLNPAAKKILVLLTVLSLAFTGAVSAHQNVLRYRVLPSYFEFQYLKDGLLQALKINKNHIHILRKNNIFYPYRYDEFGTLTEVFDPDLPVVALCAYREILTEQNFTIHKTVISHDKNILTFDFTLSNKASSATPFIFKFILTTSSLKPTSSTSNLYLLDKTQSSYTDIFNKEIY